MNTPPRRFPTHDPVIQFTQYKNGLARIVVIDGEVVDATCVVDEVAWLPPPVNDNELVRSL